MGYLYPWAGANKANKIMMEWMASRGHECRVINPLLSPPGYNENDFIERKVEDKELELLEQSDLMNHFRINGVEGFTIKSEFRIITFVRKMVEEFKPDITLVSDDQEYILLETLTETDAKVVFISHSQSTLPFGPDSFDAKPEKVKLFRRLHGVITVSQFLDNYFRTWAGVETKVLYFPSYGPGPFPYLGSFDNKYVTVINPSALKGFSIFIELAKRLPDVLFAAVPTWATAEEEVEEMKAMPNVAVLKPSENIDDIYKQTKVFLMPSLWGESFGQVVVEAMLRGIPVIASKVGGLPEAKLGLDYILSVNPIKEYCTENLLMGTVAKPIVPEQDIDPWIDSLRILIQDKAVYDELSHASYAKALAFHASLGYEVFEDYFKEISEIDDKKENDRSNEKSIHDRVSMLSSEKREQLLSLLRKGGKVQNE
jgi:glycosyltransferase involved in cell wall biosynthesis